MAMVKDRKIVICALCAFCALALFVPCFAGSAGFSDISKAFLIVVDGNQFGSDLVSDISHELSVYNYHIPGAKYPYSAYIGLKFGTYPGFVYSASFTIGSGGEIVTLSEPLGVYMTDSEFSSIIGKPTMAERVSAISDFYDEKTNGVFTTEFEQSNSTSGYESVDARFTWQSTEENTDYKVFNLYLDPTRNSGSSAFNVVCTGIKVSYTGSIDSTIVGQLNQTQQQLGELGVKVDTVVNDIALTRQDISNLQNYVASDGAHTRDVIEGTAKATQDAVNAAADQAHSDAKDTQDSINSAADQAHGDAKDTQDAINNQPNNEFNQAQEKEKEYDDQADDLQNQVDLNTVSDNVFTALRNFWSLLSSSDTQTHFYIKPFTVKINDDYYTFWEGGEFDFGHWINGDYWMYRLIFLGKFLSGIFLLTWIVRFSIDCIDYMLGNSKKSIVSIVFGYNPFES